MQKHDPALDWTYSEGCGCKITFFGAAMGRTSRMACCKDHVHQDDAGMAWRDDFCDRGKAILAQATEPRIPGHPRKLNMLYEACPRCFGNGLHPRTHKPCVGCHSLYVVETGATEGQLAYLVGLNTLRQEAGISAAMLRDGRARKALDSLKDVALLVETLRAAEQALRSYQYHNSSPDLAEEIADRARDVLAKVAP